MINGIKSADVDGGSSTRSDPTKITGQCTCLLGYTLNSKKKCVGSFGVACSKTNPCNSEKFLNCVDGICQCEAGSHQAFSSEDNSTCVLLPGSSCVAKSGPACVENSVCEKGNCRCKNGYSDSPSRKCMLSFETECTMPETINMNYPLDRREFLQPINDFCNYFQGLGCIKTKCDCFDSQLKWDKKKRMCTASVDERCGSISRMRTKELNYLRDPFYPRGFTRRSFLFTNDNSYFVNCAEGLTCTKEHNGVDGWRVCEKL